jgi:hypothetical protein
VAYRQNGELGELESSRPVMRISGLRRTILRVLHLFRSASPAFALSICDADSSSPDPNAKPVFRTPSQEIGAGLGR